jgi:hypothetical protein
MFARCKRVYAGNEVFPNVFFAIAPAASGKGALKFAKMLADEYHSFVLKQAVRQNHNTIRNYPNTSKKSAARKKATSTEEHPPNPLLKSCTFRQIQAMQKSFGTWSRTKAQALFAKPKPTPWAMYLNKSGVPIPICFANRFTMKGFPVP